MSRGRRIKRRTPRQKVGVIAMILAAILAIILLVSVVMLATKMAKQAPEEVENAEPAVVEVTEGLTESVFLSNNLLSSWKTGTVELTQEDQSQVEKWETQIALTNAYHMTITEQETYNVDEAWYKLMPGSGGNYAATSKDLSQTQTRQIDVYLTLDSNKDQWYLIQIAEQDFTHSSAYSVMPGVYFFRADGSSPIETVGGEITGEEKEEMMSLLNKYLLPNYCDLENIAGKMGSLTSKTSNYEDGGATILLESENGEVELLGTQFQVEYIFGTYYNAEGDEKYDLSVEIQYGTVFTADDVSIQCENPYQSSGTVEELRFRNGLDSATVTLSDTDKANEVWSKIEIPEEFSVQATMDTTSTVRTNQLTKLTNQTVICVQRQMLGEETYTRVEVRYMKRQIGDTFLEAGVYIYNDTYIWTDRGTLLAADAPNLLELLKAFSADTYLNVKWQLGLCGDMYLETYHEDRGYEISLIEADKPVSGFTNYARVKLNQNYQVETFQTHIRFQADNEIETAIDFGATIDYDPEKIAFSVPT